jgi:hypothetical protein
LEGWQDTFSDGTEAQDLRRAKFFFEDGTAQARSGCSARKAKVAVAYRLAHGMLKVANSLGGIVKDGAAAVRNALSNQAAAPLKCLELWFLC